MAKLFIVSFKITHKQFIKFIKQIIYNKAAV